MRRLPSVCERFRFLGRLAAKALREGFIVPLDLTPEVPRGQRAPLRNVQSVPNMDFFRGADCASRSCNLLFCVDLHLLAWSSTDHDPHTLPRVHSPDS